MCSFNLFIVILSYSVLISFGLNIVTCVSYNKMIFFYLAYKMEDKIRVVAYKRYQ